MTYGLTKGIPETGIPDELTREFKKVLKCYIRCQDKEFGAFSETPNSMPTIAMTFSAMRPLYELINSLNGDKYHKKEFDINSVFHRKKLTKLTKFLEKNRREYDSSIGYLNTIYEDDPLLCSTYYYLCIREYIEWLKRGYKHGNGEGKENKTILKDVIDKETGEKILRFVESCWKEKEGGYSCKPSSPEPTLIHTRYAILTLIKLLNAEIVEWERVQKNFKPIRILQFIHDCSRPDGGFATINKVNDKELISSVYSTRQAVKIIGYLDAMRIKGDVDGDKNYHAEFNKLFDDGKIKEIEEFLESCHDNKTGGCYAGFPFYGELENTEKKLLEKERESVRESVKDKIKTKIETACKKLLVDRSLKSLAPTYFALSAVFLVLGIPAIHSTVISPGLGNLLFSSMHVLLAFLLIIIGRGDSKGVTKRL